MAKKSKIAKNLKRMKLVEKYRERRQELIKQMNDLNLSDAEREEAARKFHNIPRDASPTRVRVRCDVTGRPRGNYRKFRLSRIKFRELAHQGMLPGITKSSW
ncbi:MAG: 30S ribosomal protein S14 [Acidobacteriota bacterium]|nr:30S ribosomal protein S14 [Acidobacteriota bacterium]